MARRPSKDDSMTFERIEVHYLYLNPDWGIVGGAPKYLGKNPASGKSISLGSGGMGGDKLQAMLDSANAKNPILNARKDPGVVDESKWKNPAAGKAFTDMQNFLWKVSDLEGWYKKQDKLIRVGRRNKMFETLPVGVGGLWVRYLYSMNMENGYFTAIDVPLIKGLGIKHKLIIRREV